MAINTINAGTLKSAFLAGAENLENNKDWINDLNVFPVPDGDTGTNMSLTIMSAANEVEKLEQVTIATLCKAISSGSLRGARGNSGVILSQLLRGFTREVQGASEITPALLASAFSRATETAYKAVMKPKEGTILTVARGMAEKAAELAPEAEAVDTMLEAIIAYGDEVLAQTPEMLPVLKQAGVVDSGGQGLMQAMKGALEGLRGNYVPHRKQERKAPERPETFAKTEDLGEIKFGYCTEFIINISQRLPHREEKAFRAFLDSMGDSIVLVPDEELIKVHVHTNDPGKVLSKALTYGSLSRIKIDNMREEHQEKLIRDASRLAAQQKAEAEAEQEPRKEAGFLAVSVGDGLEEIFSGLNVDVVLAGGQTMNPSTEDMLEAIDRINADVVYVFPNNKNIILTADQAAELVEDKRVVVVPSRTIPQGIAALINFSPVQSPEENLEQMKECMELVKTGEVTYAVRNTVIDDVTIHEGDIMGLGDHSALLSVGSSINEVTEAMIEAMMEEESELVSIYYGQDISEEQAATMEETIVRRYPDCDVEVHYGGQPIYYYIVSVE